MGEQGNRMNKEITAEDYCFVCKDGGVLVICDYGDCLKAYHSHCLKKIPLFTKTESCFECGWHLCHHCKKSSNLKCFCCPKSLCWKCFGKGDIVVVKELMGFCRHCLKLALMIEENINVDSDGGTVDFNDTDTYEFLFKDYWEIIKDSEKVSLTELRRASASLKNGSYLELEFDSEKNEIEFSNAMDGEFQATRSFHISRVKSKTSYQKRRLERKHFNGWGSEQLITFLKSIGEDCNEPIAQIDVSDVIRKYITKNKLLHSIKKKKKVSCDEKLYLLFNKRSFKLNKINALLDSHYSENLDDDFLFDSEEDNELVDNKKRRIEHTTIPKLRNDSEVPKSCYASVVAENIKLLYLKKSLFLELLNNLKNSGEFENKVVGCFVRVKNNPNDLFYSRDKPYQLGQITGIRKRQEVFKIGETSTDIVLRVTNLFKDINISMLCDGDFEEEECEDLRQLIKNGHVKRPMFRDFEMKSVLLHEDITRHWINREMTTLQRKIERASEKGWQRELHELINRRELLRTDAEKARLLKEIPRVIPDIELVTEGNLSSPILRRNEEDEVKINANTVRGQVVDNGTILKDHLSGQTTTEDEVKINVNTVQGQVADNGHILKDHLSGQTAAADEVIFNENASQCQAADNWPILKQHISEKTSEDEDKFNKDIAQVLALDNAPSLNECTSEKTSEERDKAMRPKEICDISQIAEIDGNDDSHRQNQPKQIEIINLDDDDDDDADDGIRTAKNKLNICIWNYIDPQGDAQGPFQLDHLRKWRHDGFFDDGFKVWKDGHSRDEAILLIDLLRQIEDV